MKNKNRGITLIALVITVIILLILAGVAISALVGDNGLLKNMSEVVEKSSRAEAKEKLDLVLMELQTDKVATTEYNEQEYVNNRLKKNNMKVEGNIVIVDGWQFKIDRSILKIVEETQLAVGTIISSEDILNNPQEYYGKEVKYSTKKDVTVASINSLENLNLVADVDTELENDGIKWRIFYSDKEHIYLIASDYVKVDGDNDYKIFDTANEILEFMNTKSNWKEYVGNNAEYALGGPTFTMFSSSWSSKHPEEKIVASGNETNGWMINHKSKIEDDLYFKGDYGYWLASKATDTKRYLVHVTHGCIASWEFAYNEQYGEEANLRRIHFRPIVCLKSDIKLQATSEGFIIANDDKDVTGYTYKNPIVPNGFSKLNTDDAKWEDTDGDGNPDGWNNGLVIKDENNNQFVWVPVDGSILKYNKEYSYKTEYEEFYTTADGTIDDTLPTGITDDEEQIIKYGGFYIGRYEAGVPDKNGEPVNQEGIPVSQKDAVAWTNLEYVTAKASAEKMYTNENIKSGLVAVRAWVTLTKWVMMNKPGNFDERQYGNYANAVEPANIEGYGEKQKTGYSDKWKCKNIYDLLGNVEEWGNGVDDFYAYMHGGSYEGMNYSMNGSSGRTKKNAYEDYIGFRVMLYIM